MTNDYITRIWIRWFPWNRFVTFISFRLPSRWLISSFIVMGIVVVIGIVMVLIVVVVFS